MVKKDTTKKTVKEKVIKAAFDLAKTRGWEHVTLAEIAEAAGFERLEIHDDFADKTDILIAYGRLLDRKVLEAVGESASEESPRERLFDLLMERFDLLNEDRDAIVSILCSFKLAPKEAVISLPHLGRSMSWMLEAAGVSTDGISGAVKVAGLTGLYLNLLRCWREDKSPDMSKTMAALDRDLGRAERFAASFLR